MRVACQPPIRPCGSWQAECLRSDVLRGILGLSQQIRPERAFEPRDLVLQQQLSLLQPLQCELVVQRVGVEPVDRLVEIAVLDAQIGKARGVLAALFDG